MANAPDRFDVVLLPDGVEKVTIMKDEKTPNTTVFKIEREDHTLGNLLRMQLHRDPNVLFAAYKAPHPLQYHILLRIQTQGDTKNQQHIPTPEKVLENAITDLKEELAIIAERFSTEFKLFSEQRVNHYNY